MNEKPKMVARFFECIEHLKQTGRISGRADFCNRYNINRRNLWKLERNPQSDIFKAEWLAILAIDFGISADWLVTGRGEMDAAQDFRAKLAKYVQMGLPPFVSI